MALEGLEQSVGPRYAQLPAHHDSRDVIIHKSRLANLYSLLSSPFQVLASPFSCTHGDGIGDKTKIKPD